MNNRLILLSGAFITLVVIVLFLTFENTTHTISHESGQHSLETTPKPSKPNPKNPTISKIDVLLLPDFQLASDRIPDQDFVKLFKHFSSSNTDAMNENYLFPAPILVETIKQIHHGIYKIEARLPDASLVKFAFKTECRPASKWHGQQGYSEVLVNWVVKELFSPRNSKLGGDNAEESVPYPIGSFTLGAVGGFVQLPEKFEKEIHRDGCGFLSEDQIKRMKFAKLDANLGKVLVGVVLQWIPGHRDDAIPGTQALDPWRISSKSTFKKNLAVVVNNDGRSKPAVLQMSDIFVLDYIVGNEDRLEKNWFKDSHDRFFAMDNGWALAGLNYAGSVCDLDVENLKCPPLFRGLASKECKTERIVNCRFRATTIERVKNFVKAHENAEAGNSKSIIIVANDPLVAFLLKFYGKFSKTKKGRRWSDALARFVDSCRMEDENESDHGKLIDRLIRSGLVQRSKKLLEHVESCVDKFGKNEVMLS